MATDERLVSFAPLTITQANFPSLSKEQTSEVVREIEKVFPDEERVIALDRVLANIDKSQIVPKNVEGVKADPPPVFFSEKPAVLLGFDGDPVWSPIESNDLKFAVNTNWDVFQHAPTVTYYVRNEETWLKASALEGPWQPAGKLPESFQKLPNDDNWKEVKASLPGKKLSTKSMPTVFVSYAPAELILLEGEPKYEPVTGTNLLWVSNTESDLFRMGKDGPVYVEPAEAGGVTYFVSAGDHYLPYLEPTGQELYIQVNAPLAAAAGAVTTKSVPLTVASGASLKVRLATTLDSGKNKAGDAFEGHLDSDLVAQGQIVATKGSRVQGKVREAKHAEGSQAPLLALELTSVASGGKMIPITTNVTQSQGKAPQTGKKLLGGAAIGATIGAIADGGEGAAVGGIAGAMVGGVAGAATTKEVTLPGGTVLEFQTNQAATFYKNVTVQKSAEP